MTAKLFTQRSATPPDAAVRALATRGDFLDVERGLVQAQAERVRLRSNSISDPRQKVDAVRRAAAAGATGCCEARSRRSDRITKVSR